MKLFVNEKDSEWSRGCFGAVRCTRLTRLVYVRVMGEIDDELDEVSAVDYGEVSEVEEGVTMSWMRIFVKSIKLMRNDDDELDTISKV